MGWLQNRRARMVDEIAKAIAPGIAAAGKATGAVDISALVNAATQQPMAPNRGINDLDWTEPYVPFGPGRPIGPVPIDPRLPDTGRALPRRSEYPVAWNLPGQGQPHVPWVALRRFADQVDVARLCIGVRKKELTGIGWSIAVKEDLVQSIAQAQGDTPARARIAVTQQMAGEIERLTKFWQRPDNINRLTFGEWLSQLLEEVLVLDALSIYPHPDLGGRLHSLEILDGATIKPLLDNRGAFPQPPQPAYQQVLWGFPRGEYTLSEDQGDGVETMTSDELIYRPRERRTWTPYGFSAVEQALIAGDLYLKRQQWLRSEYTDGAIPAALMIPPEALKWTPEQVRQYELAINAELSGQTQDRMRWRMTPPGVTIATPANFAERYNSQFDEYLIKLLCGFFDVLPSEIGFTPHSGLGGAGHQSGEADSAMRRGNRPMLEWLADIFNEINHEYLGAPEELTFNFDLGESEDIKMKADVAKSDISVGKRTLNDTRAEDGLPLYDFEEADEPFVLTPNGPIFIRGSKAQADTMNEFAKVGAQAGIDQTKGSQEPKPPNSDGGEAERTSEPPQATTKSVELDAFWRYAKGRQGRAWREFTFKSVEAGSAAHLNELGKIGDLATLKTEIQKAARPKVKARTGPGLQSHKNLVAHFTKPIAQALAGAIDVQAIVEHYYHGRILKAAQAPIPYDPRGLQEKLDELTRQAWAAGQNSALDQLGKSVDWTTWTPGNAEAANLIKGRGLRELLNKQGVTIKSILDARMSQLGDKISEAIDNGWSVSQTTSMIQGLLEDPSRAEMVANTETNRAMTASTMETYGENGVQKVDWLLSGNPCPECEENADSGPIDYGDEWPNGDPPVHPNCQCSLAPAEVSSSDGTSEEG